MDKLSKVQKANQTLKLFLHPKNVFLAKLDSILIHIARKDQFQSHFQAYLKNNRLNCQNNRLFHAFIV